MTGPARVLPSGVLAGQRESASRQPAVLLVDDDVDAILALRSALGQDHQLFMARGGAEALSLAKEVQLDLILLDVDMPGMDGYEVCTRLKATPELQAVPVMFITGYRDGAAELRALEAGASDFVSKPVEPRILRARARTHPGQAAG